MRTPAVAVAALVIVLDTITKTVLITAPWAYHQQNREWQLVALVGCCAVGTLMLFPSTALGASLLFAGVAANLLDSILNGRISNPFLIDTSGAGLVAFNLADVSLYVGAAVMMLSAPAVTRDVLAAWRARA